MDEILTCCADWFHKLSCRLDFARRRYLRAQEDSNCSLELFRFKVESITISENPFSVGQSDFVLLFRHFKKLNLRPLPCRQNCMPLLSVPKLFKPIYDFACRICATWPIRNDNLRTEKSLNLKACFELGRSLIGWNTNYELRPKLQTLLILMKSFALIVLTCLIDLTFCVYRLGQSFQNKRFRSVKDNAILQP